LAQSIPVDGLLLVDPVDSDPMNMTKPVLVEKTLLNVPTMVLSSGLGTVPGWNLGNRFPACCPPLYSSRHFYTMLDTPFKVELKALNYGHADLLSPDPVAWAAHKSRFCASTKDSRATPFDAYRNWNSGAISAFIQMVVGKQKDCKSYKEWLTGGWNVDTELVAIDGKYC
jgi:hypothetical protein